MPDARAGWLLVLAALLLTALAPAAAAAPPDRARGGVEVAVRAAPSFTSTPVTDVGVGEPYVYRVTATDPDGDALSFDAGPLPEWLSVDPGPPNDGAITLQGTPTAADVGAYALSILVSDGTTVVEQAFTLTVRAPPVAEPDGYTTPEDVVLAVAAPGVLSNDSDPNGDALTAVLEDGVANGALDLRPDGSFTYTPDPDFVGTDAFTYRAVGGGEASEPVAVAITVTPVNDAPVAQPDVYATAEEQTLTAPPPGVLGNDADPDGDPLTAVLEDGVANGALDLRPDGSFTYTPDPDFVGTDVFTYRASDGALASAAVPVRITVGGRNDAPVARPDVATTAEDQAVTIDVLANDTDPDGDPLSVLAVTQPSNGVATVTAGGADVRYTPNANANGQDTFTYTVSDGNGATATATVTVVVAPVNDRPVARLNVYETPEDVRLSVAAPGVLGNDADPDGDLLEAQLVAGPARGVLDLRPDGSFTYTPAPNASGTVTFRYRASDGTLTSSPATVTITVTPVDDLPVARPDVYEAAEDRALRVAAPGVLGNDTDPDNALTTMLVTGPENGALDLRPNGSFTYTPDPDFAGRDGFTYRAVGGGAASAPVAVTITVGGRNDRPVARDDAATTAEDQAVTIAVLDNDTDPDGDPLSVASVVQPSNGTATISPDGTTVVYTPNPDFNGADAFSYAASDGSGETASASVSVTVTPVNDAPVATDDAASTRAGEPVLIAVLANDADVDGDALAVASVSAPASGRAAVEGGAVRYTPDAGFVGDDAFTYTVTDGNGGAATGTVTVTVRPAGGGAAVASEAGPARVGAPVTVAVAATAFTPSSADLFYRPAGGGAYRVTPLAPAEGGYAGTIPADAVTARGVDYYVVLSGDGVRATDPAETPAQDPRHVRVAIPRADAPVAFERDGYRMVALPLVPETPTPAAVFADDLGAYDPTVWRLFRWDPERGAYDEFPDIAVPLVPGRGVWLAARAGAGFDVTDALSADASGPVALTLAPGWTQIGTPFGFAVAWDDVEGSEAVSAPVAWDGAEYVFDQPTLEPWRGYFVENPTDGPVTLTVPPLAAGAAARRGPIAASGGYRLRLSVTARQSGAGDLRDTQNVVGFDAAAAPGRDRLDWAEPPPPGPHVRLSLLADGARLARSLQPDGGGGAAWDAEVTASADLLAAPLALRLALDDERPLPDGYGRYVLDLDRGAALATDGGAVEVTLSAADPVRRLRVVVGTEAFAASVAGGVPLEAPAFGLERAAPNPVRVATTLAFSVPAPGPVTLDVVDVLGRRVAVLVDGERGAGRYEVSWSPAGLASGTYVVRLRAAGESAAQTVTVVR